MNVELQKDGDEPDGELLAQAIVCRARYARVCVTAPLPHTGAAVGVPGGGHKAKREPKRKDRYELHLLDSGL